jgi:alkylation response protein AidB-like acyl-CoA dehydrogenase
MMTMLSKDEVRQRIAAILPPRRDDVHVSTLGAGGYDLPGGRRFLAAVRPDGFGVPAWPAQFGGRNANPDEAAMIETVIGEFVVPDLYPFRVGLRMVGPTVLEHGTADQRDRWLPPIAAGADIWCQMFSEPEAGSDLANAATAAERSGDGWVLNGQKVWTSRAAYADWGICLTRTEPSAPKHRGLTMFAVQMSEPGVEVRALVQMNGDSHFSEVFLSDVHVADHDRIGDVGQGWAITITLLAHERAGGSRSAPLAVADRIMPSWLAAMQSRGAFDDPVLRDRTMALYAYEQAVRWTEARNRAGDGGRPGPSGSGLKLSGARSFKRRTELLAAAEGARAMLTGWPGYTDLLTAPSMSIRGGTDEVQQNVIGERVLGLPKDPAVDRDVPWSQQRRTQANQPKEH